MAVLSKITSHLTIAETPKRLVIARYSTIRTVTLCKMTFMRSPMEPQGEVPVVISEIKAEPGTTGVQLKPLLS